MKNVTPPPEDASLLEDSNAGTSSPALTRTRKSIAQLESDVAHYPEPIRTETVWMQGFLLDHCQNNIEALRGIAAKIGIDRSREYFANLIGGDYFTNKPSTWQPNGSAWSTFLELVNGLRRYAQQAERTGQIEFVQTPTYQAIANFITARRALAAVCKFGGIVGPTGSQKSESFRFYRALNNHGAVIHVEAPANGRLTTLQSKIARAYHVSESNILRRREAAVRENVNETRCIIIDNVQDLYERGAGSKQPTFNWLRELQDDTRCTIILSFTDDFLRQDLTGGVAKGYFEQFVGRMGGTQSLLLLPQYTPAADVRVIARSFGLDPTQKAMAILTRWAEQTGRVRILFHRLQLAQQFARFDGRARITLADLEEAGAHTPPSTVSEQDGGEL